MEQKILGFAGAKESGKDTSARFLVGYTMLQNGRLKYFDVDDDGVLWVNTYTRTPEGELDEGRGAFDINQWKRSPAIKEYCIDAMFPYIKVYSCADRLKEVAMSVFGLTWSQCYGSNEDKDTLCPVKWVDFARLLPPKVRKRLKDQGVLENNMTAREFLQWFGTDVCRKIKDDCWIGETLQRIRTENSQFAIISDCRFINEVEGIQHGGGRVIRLLRHPHTDGHTSESALDKYENFDAVLDNREMSVAEQNEAVLQILTEWEWV